ncbi:MAG TPA: AMP-binding protein, partial [Pyrinomonadaceae bacterium]|nr:AMP-binding protein [Pyrinomonadaceae bacterium]
DSLAYVIFTSGSTGRPKGVEVAHRGMASLARWHARAFEVAHGDRAAQTAGLSFDACGWELWPYLAAGASVHIVDEETRLSPTCLRDWIINSELTHCFLTTPLAEQIIMLDWPRDVALRVLLTGAERLRVWPPPALPFKLFNNYGVTECTVVSTSGVVERGESDATTPHVGRPVDNTEIYILDRHGNPSPVGVAGELHIGGCGLARGYARQAALTAERFVPNPFSREPGARLYRTGDWARYLPGGEIELTGTRDGRVKLRGHRVETGEVEAVLARQAAVSECVVIAGQDARGETRLVAYVVHAGGRLDVSELRDALRETLPEYMIPSAFVSLNELPLTPNGKVDRRALPAPDWRRLETREAPLAPRDERERRLADIWAEVLGLEEVGVRDNFFDLGGHSLLAVRLLARIEEAFGVRLPLASLFQGATVERQAALVARPRRARPTSSLVSMHAGGAGVPFFFAHPVGGTTLCYYALAKRLGGDRPVYGFQATEANETKASLEEVAAVYVEELIEARAEGPYLLGGWSAGGVIAFEMARQLQRRGRRVALVALIDTRSPLVAAETPGRADDDAAFLKRLAEEYALWRGKPLQLPLDALRGLDADAQLDYVLRRLQEAGLLPPGEEAADPARWRAIVNSHRKTARMVAGYVPRRVEGGLTLLRASESPRGRAAACVAGASAGGDATKRLVPADDALGWDEFTSSPVSVHFVPGDHFSMMTEPHVGVVAERLTACIKQTGVE